MNIIDKLLEFRQRDKFSQNAWNERGLNPSDNELCRYLNNFFNNSTDRLISAIENGKSSKQIKRILESEMDRLKKSDYDTEEKEFICDLFLELAIIVDIDFRDNLDKWLYGSLLVVLLKVYKIIRPKKNVAVLQQPCTQCSISLKTIVLRKDDRIVDMGWWVAKCNNCSELNLLSPGTNLKEVKHENYQFIEILDQNEYTYEQALVRLEQIKYFRK